MYSVIYEISMYVHRQTLSLILFYSNSKFIIQIFEESKIPIVRISDC